MQRREHQRQDRIGDARAGGQSGCESEQPLVFAKPLDERVENWRVHDDRPDCASGGTSW